jgi:senataxin
MHACMHACMQVEASLEMSFVTEAEMVFTTLSSTGRRIFQRLEGAPFETVLIDEAAQASEIAALQPLVFGAKRCVSEMSSSTYTCI